jgi:hypothetical protein
MKQQVTPLQIPDPEEMDYTCAFTTGPTRATGRVHDTFGAKEIVWWLCATCRGWRLILIDRSIAAEA